MMNLQHLKQSRMKLGLTQTEFAKRAGLSQSLITKIEAGKIDPKYSTVQRIEQTLVELEQKEQPSVASIVHKGIISATLQEKILHLIKRMQKEGISQVPVMDGKHVAGLITETIILEAMSAGKNLGDLTAQEIMAEAPPILPATTPLPTAAKLLEHIPLLIIKEKSSILGIVTRSDLIKAQL